MGVNHMRALFLLLAVFVAFSVAADLDGDGYDSDPSFGEFQDCCDSVDDGCYDPYLVNPGAWEIPDNGQADRCIEGRDRRNNIPCDAQRLNSNVDIYTFFTGTQGTPPRTERAIWAMDTCEFKDDDDDPSWGFARQRNMVFSLADGTRNSFDIGVIGPDERQVSVLKGLGKITPANGNYVLAISTGVAQDIAGPDFIAPSPGLTTQNDVVVPPQPWAAQNPGRSQAAIDSIMGTFYMVQPSNMNAWSLQVAHLSAERARDVSILSRNGCNNADSFILVLQNDTSSVGPLIPADHNVARDEFSREFCTSNPSEDYFQYCNIYNTVNGQQQCRKSNYKLQETGFENLFGTPWRPVGGPAVPRNTFQIKLATWDVNDGTLDTTALFDDYLPVAEIRQSRPTGYMYASDIELERIVPNPPGIYPSSTTSVTMTFVVKNNGPEQAEDITINFTPPKGMFYQGVSAGWTLTTTQAAAAPYQDNSFYKIRRNTAVLAVGATTSGTITFGVRANAPREIQVKLSATCSSVEKIWMNNYQIQMIYIDKLVADN